MEFSDIILLCTAYIGFCCTVFVVVYGYSSLYSFFKSIADPGFKND